MSLIYSPINNVMFYGVLVETILFIVIVYVPGLNSAWGARPLDILILVCLDYHLAYYCSVGRKPENI